MHRTVRGAAAQAFLRYDGEYVAAARVDRQEGYTRWVARVRFDSGVDAKQLNEH